MRFLGPAVLGALLTVAACTGGDSPPPIAFDVTVSFNWYGPPDVESIESQFLEEHADDRDEILGYLEAHAEDVEQLATTEMFPTWANPLLARVLTDDSQFCQGFVSEFEPKDYVGSVSCAEAEDGSAESP